MTSYLNNGCDIMNYFAKFEKFLPHSIIMPSFMTVGSQMPELDWGGGTGFVWLTMTKVGVYISLLWHITKKIWFRAIYFLQFSFYLILTSCTKFEFNSLRNNEITMTLSIQSFLAVTTKQKSEMTSYLNNGYDVMNYFAKFEKFFLIV